jgi:hypothetical protein
MDDPYDDKPVPNVRISDVLGIGVVCVIGAVTIYLLVMLIYHWIAGHPPP